MTCDQVKALAESFDCSRATLAETAALARHLVNCEPCLKFALSCGEDLPVREQLDAIRRANAKLDELAEAMRHDPEL